MVDKAKLNNRTNIIGIKRDRENENFFLEKEKWESPLCRIGKEGRIRRKKRSLGEKT